MNKQKEYIKRYKNKKRLVLFIQLFIFIFTVFIWEFLSRYNIINTFITSSPSNIIKTIYSLYETNNLFVHINTTISETFVAFSLTTIISIIISIIMYENDVIAKVFDPYLTILNSLPKVALGPILIIWIGSNKLSIITMAILISIIISIQNIYSSFKNTDQNRIKLFKTFKANKKQLLFNVVLPSNYKSIINTLKINISMSLVGVIMGEFLTSKQGLGYLILYGSQIFNLNLVITSIVLLIIISLIMYGCIILLEKRLVKN